MLQGNATSDSVYPAATIPPPPGESDIYRAATRVQQAPLTGMTALLQGGEVDSADRELRAALRHAPTLRVAGPVREADDEPGALCLANGFGTTREWLVVATLAVAGASAVFAVALVFS